MASDPITSWQIDRETVEILTGCFLFFFWRGASIINAGGNCSHEIKRHLLFGRKAMINLDSILRSRDITLPAKVCLVKAMIFPIIMYRCDSLTIRKAECQRIEVFKLWCWRRPNPSILKEINPEH